LPLLILKVQLPWKRARKSREESSQSKVWVHPSTDNQHQTNSSRLVRYNNSWAFVLWKTNEILHCYWEDRIHQTASHERTWVDDHNFLASLNRNVVRASLAADACSSAVTWYTMNATA
jgi:hypothetical protein